MKILSAVSATLPQMCTNKRGHRPTVLAAGLTVEQRKAAIIEPRPWELYQHSKAIAAVRIPIVVYSVQGGTGVNVGPATLKRVSEIDNITGVKEASGNVAQMGAILSLMPEGSSVLSGDDAVALPLIALGGRGFISVVSNEIPAEMTRLVQLSLENHSGVATLERRSRRSDIAAVDPVRCGIPGSDQSLRRGRWL